MKREQNKRHKKATDPELVEGDGAVGVEDELVGRDGVGLFEFRREEEADGAEELQLRLARAVDAEEAVHVAHRQPVHVRLALLLLAHLFRCVDIFGFFIKQK